MSWGLQPYCESFWLDIDNFRYGIRVRNCVIHLAYENQRDWLYQVSEDSYVTNANVTRVEDEDSWLWYVVNLEWLTYGNWTQWLTMIRESRQLVTDEPVEVEKSQVEVQDFRRITDHFRGIYGICLNLLQKNRRMSPCNRLDLQTLGSELIMPKNLPITGG